ncbi:MAG: NADH-quinone oxidoreductase subunit [Fimbriimonadaceae bacterium]|jgi:NADH-quinone oxidoreductase subunit J|nr:NADH-quinone oxidoreductase subunit [Fimbriimonadaceae bacterium]
MQNLTQQVPLLFFGAVAGVAAMAAVGVVAFGSAIRSALCLVLNFFLLSILYFTLGSQTLGIIQIVVYTGAIMVLFLFVIMLLNLGGIKILHEKRDPRLILGGVLGLGLFALIATQILLPLQRVTQPRAAQDFGKPESLGVTLFSGYVWPFELASFLLLIGIVGSILLAKRRILPSERQEDSVRSLESGEVAG